MLFWAGDSRIEAGLPKKGFLKDVLDNCDYQSSFQTGWNYVQNWFYSFTLFCGGMATAFPGTSNVLSDFSIVKWEKGVMWMSLSNFSLEGILHARQYNKIYNLEK